MEQLDIYCSHCGASNHKEEVHCFACGHTLADADAPADTTAPEILLQQRYRLLNKIGEGGFSIVYRAEDIQTRQVVAVKAVSLRGLSAQEKIEATDAFNREVTILTKLTHRNLPRLYRHFSDAECWYMVMDYIEGETLEKYLERHQQMPFRLEEVLDIGTILCDVLDYLHSNQPPIIFRDLKPANIMVTSAGYIYVIDFGIARQFKQGKPKDTIPFGSPGYAAPEQYGKAQTTPRSDIYSLGAILHQLMTGSDPSQSPFAFAPLPNLHQQAVAKLDTLLQRMVALDSQRRPDSMVEVQESLQEISRLHYHQQGLSSQYYRPTLSRTFQTAAYAQPLPSTPTPNNAGVATFVQQQQQQQQTFYAASPFAQSTTPPPSNRYQLYSILCSLIGIFMPPFLCLASTQILFILQRHIPITLFIYALLLAPSVLGIVFGHKGRDFARRTGTSADTATVGLTLGYLFTAIYLVFALCFFSTTILFMPHILGF
ncbi:serine/threonine protein kinase [Dictyobacter aurantiacus]|uniref:Protein kinase domain-containing protein n=1 Tax=Dictyobacter aurantiacus TaxID=1936993 RepID=A0A401ZG97_9CHLR|nr:serine/threonine-protein kinase [Dictyobacter aurantiacus]GCE05887.1 hypothetical protein KDAU_32160 [Dictyobacter aurantiacus]